MKVQLKVTIEVDAAEWSEEYGCERTEVREDVRRYFTDLVISAAASEGVDYTVRVA